jgi:hypothetical protein
VHPPLAFDRQIARRKGSQHSTINRGLRNSRWSAEQLLECFVLSQGQDVTRWHTHRGLGVSLCNIVSDHHHQWEGDVPIVALDRVGSLKSVAVAL